MKDEALEVARAVLIDLHRAELLTDTKSSSSEIADKFVLIARGLDELQADDVRDAIYRNWAIRDGDSLKKRAVKLLEDEGVAVLVRFARNGTSGTKPLRLFSLNETKNTASFLLTTARQYSAQADLWADAERRHSEQPDLTLGQVLGSDELTALADAYRETAQQAESA